MTAAAARDVQLLLPLNVPLDASAAAAVNQATSSRCRRPPERRQLRSRPLISSFYPRDAMLARLPAMALCLCLSQVGVLSKRLNESGWFLVWELLSAYLTLCCKEIQVSSKIRALPSGSLLQTLDLEHFATAYQSSTLVMNPARERWTLRA